ncbi:hypothetical protein L0669_04435 [Flavobacterium bizetiae]|uniref:hypothetical protein n=1 Tax=Flavobacterium bizetiae TaxID=2704140 RepID=UPI0021E90387|nr:hypothetical protein [Flavobacterium bizetiae]UTN05156.1 hypothetical protein L0669_04435 [Flavobacterium bizetiae]
MAKEKIDISMQFVIFTTTIAIWIYLYDKIVELTTNQPTNDSLLILSVCHYLSFICIFLSFIILTNKTFNLKKSNYFDHTKFNDFSILSHKILFSLWAPMFVFSLISILSVNFSGNIIFKYQSPLVLLFSLIITGLFFKIILGIQYIKIIQNINIKSLWIFLSLVSFYFLYVSTLVLHSSSIDFKTDKEFYQDNDIVKLQIKPRGYIFLPRIEKVAYNINYENFKKDSDHTYSLNLKKHPNNGWSIIEIVYESQIFNIIKKDYHDLNRN